MHVLITVIWDFIDYGLYGNSVKISTTKNEFASTSNIRLYCKCKGKSPKNDI